MCYSVQNHRYYHKRVGYKENGPEFYVSHSLPNASVEWIRLNPSVCDYENNQPLHIYDPESYKNTLVEISNLGEEYAVAEPHLKEPNEHADNPHVLLFALIACHSTISVETHKESNYADVVSQHHKLEIMSYPLACALISHISVVIR